MRAARIVVIALGAILVGVGGGALVAGVPPRQWVGILLWMGGAVVLHDAVFAPLVLVGSRILRRIGARVSWVQVAIVQVALVVGAALTLIAVPGIVSKSLGARNPSVLVFAYAPTLAIAWGAIGVLTALLVLAIGLRKRRPRPSVL